MNDKSRHTDKPPLFAKMLLKTFLRNGLKQQRLSEFEEIYSSISKNENIYNAKSWYWRHTVKSIPKLIYDSIYWGVTMFANYIKIAIRNIKKQKWYSIINVTGFAVGMACCILIMLWVKDELSYDKFHDNADLIYRVTEHQYNSSGEYFQVAVTPWPLAAALKDDYLEITESARLRILKDILISYKDRKFYESDLVAVDPSFLKMFSFPLLKGDISTALVQPNTILITEEMAKKYFGNEDPMGKILNYNNVIDFKVVGLLKNVPKNSHIMFDFLVPFESTLHEFGWSDSWWDNNYTTYIQLVPNTKVESLSNEITNYLKKAYKTQIKLIMQPLTDIHLQSDYIIDLYGSTENKEFNIYAFSVIALFILIIACINFMNLSTARSEKRSKEVGLRQVVGANRTQIINQFYSESILLTFISFIAALILVVLLLPFFNNVTGKELSIGALYNPLFILGLLVIVFVTGLISGSYTALILSSFKAVDTIRNIRVKNLNKTSKSRRTLVVIQFTLSVILIVGVVIVYQQINYMLSKNLGYEKDSILYFNKRANVNRQYDAFKSQLLSDPNIIGVTCSSDLPTYTVHSTGAFTWEGRNWEIRFLMYHFSVDHDFIKTFNMNVIEGRDFSNKFPVDDSTKSFIINETAAKAMGLEDPIGKQFSLYENSGRIVGVIEDFNFKSLQTRIEPLVLRIEQSWDSYVFVKYKSINEKEAIKIVTKIYDTFNPDFPLKYSFLDREVKTLYSSEERTKEIFNYFTIMAIIISCLGLYGLSLHMAEQKTKEIGIRKVLGATITNIVTILTKESALLVVIANVIAWPIAYYFMNEWLNNFAYRIEISIWIFILGGLISLTIALLTISYQSIKAATANPVESIKHE